MKKVVILAFFIALVGCSSTSKNKVSLEEKYNIDTVAMKNWEKTYSEVIIGESELVDWYGDENPLNYLAKNGKLSEKKAKFLSSLSTKKNITEEDKEQFNSTLEKIVKKLPRKFYLKDENFKNPIGLAKYMVAQSKENVMTPSKYIATKVATPEEWNEIVVFSKKSDLNEKQVKRFRKLMNRLIKRDNFFNQNVWYNVEISPRVIEIDKINSKKDKTKLEINNINAKALYIAYPGYFSELERWND